MSEQKNREETDTEQPKFLNTSETKSLATDLAEIVFDKLFESDNEILQKIPFVKGLLAVSAFGKDIQKRFFMKKVYSFLNGLTDADEFLKDKIETAFPNAEDKEEVIDVLIFALEHHDQLKKADILCKLFLARIYGLITHRELEKFRLALDKIDLNDIDYLKEFYQNKNMEMARGKDGNNEVKDVLRTFLPYGLISVEYREIKTSGQLYPTSGTNADELFSKNSLGEKFLKALNFKIDKTE